MAARPEQPSAAALADDVHQPTELPPTTRTDAATAPPPWVPGEGDRPGLHVRLFGSHMFFRLWSAQVVSALGDWLGFLAITIVAARVGGAGGGAAVGLVMTARILPGFFLAPVAGVMVDRLDRKKVMVTCDIGRAMVVALLPFVNTVLGLVFASFLLEIGTLLWSPAKEASVPNLVPSERLASANSLSLAAAYGTFPVAAALFAFLAGVATWLGHIDTLSVLRTDQEALAFYVDALTFLASAFLISRLVLPPRVRSTEVDAERIDFTQTIHELKEGWQFIFINPVVRAVNLGLAIGLVGGGMVVPLGSVFSIEVLGAGAAGYGVFITALGFGVAIGVVLISVTQSRLPKAQVFSLSLFVAGGSLLLAACMSTLATAVLCVGVLGVCAGSVYVLGFTLLQENTSDELRGRIFSALYSLVRLCLILAFAVGPFLSDLLNRIVAARLSDCTKRQLCTAHFPGGFHVDLPGVRLTLWLAGLIVLGGGMLTALSLRRGMAEQATAAADHAPADATGAGAGGVNV